MKEKPFLLLSNDDGFAAKGIQELIKVLRPMADLMVVAPSGPRSGASGSITSEHPLRCKKIESAPGFRGNLLFRDQVIQVLTFYFFEIQNGSQVFLPESGFMQAGVGHDPGHLHVGKRESVVQLLYLEQFLGLFYSSFLKSFH